ncbi:MAG: hypothetical protein HY897_03170 [Deltaproteobacteria bacterium]|nr:hypothetical protein [Deltaproteobacteria bacterium]
MKFESAGSKERANRWKADFPNMTLVEIQKAVVLATIEDLGWDKHKAAKRLGMGHTTLKDKLRAWGYGRDGGKE